MKLSTIMLGSEDAAKLAAFYTKLLGEPGWSDGGWYGYDVGGVNIMIGNHSEVKGRSSTPARIMLNFEVSDVKAEVERVKATGAEIIAEAYQPDPENMPDAWIATFADPDGNYFQLATP